MKLAEHIDTGARCGPAQDLSEPLTKAAAKEEGDAWCGWTPEERHQGWSTERSVGTGTSLIRPASEERTKGLRSGTCPHREACKPRALEPIIQSEVSQRDKHQYSILMHIYGI